MRSKELTSGLAGTEKCLLCMDATYISSYPLSHFYPKSFKCKPVCLNWRGGREGGKGEEDLTWHCQNAEGNLDMSWLLYCIRPVVRCGWTMVKEGNSSLKKQCEIQYTLTEVRISDLAAFLIFRWSLWRVKGCCRAVDIFVKDLECLSCGKSTQWTKEHFKAYVRKKVQKYF